MGKVKKKVNLPVETLEDKRGAKAVSIPNGKGKACAPISIGDPLRYQFPMGKVKNNIL